MRSHVTGHAAWSWILGGKQLEQDIIFADVQFSQVKPCDVNEALILLNLSHGSLITTVNLYY
jgi:hypothetical protein